MKYWIASYPRSGNTFLRILFKEVYGIKTWEGYGKQTPKKVLGELVDKTSSQPILIKTHELPCKTQIPHKELKAIYLVRDGRDAVISLAYHRSQIVKPGSSHKFNLLTNVLVPFGTSFGGWSKHVKQWKKHALHIIKFEDLIADPKTQLQQLEKLMNLPPGDYSKIPTFNDLKNKKYILGSGKNTLSLDQQQKARDKFFRSGKTKTWRNEMSKPLQDVFIYKHGTMLKNLGYDETNSRKFIIFKIIKYYSLWFLGYIKENWIK